MIFSNNNIFTIKCYLKLIEIVADRMHGHKLVATANNDFQTLKTLNSNT